MIPTFPFLSPLSSGASPFPGQASWPVFSILDEQTKERYFMKRKEEAMKKYIASFLAITQPALKAVSCTDIATGAGGHRYGLCQMGAALRAKNGDSASNILLYYYTDCRIISCTLK